MPRDIMCCRAYTSGEYPETHFCENGQYSRPLLHKCVIQYTNTETYTHIARWGCEFAVGRNASSLSLSSLCGYWGHGLMQKNITIHLLSFSSPPLSSLFCIYHPAFPSLVFSSPLFSFCLLSFSPHPLSWPSSLLHLFPLLLPTSLSFPLTSCPRLSLLPITFCLNCSTAQHVMAQPKYRQEG